MKKFIPMLGYVLSAILAVVLFRQCEATDPDRNAGVESSKIKELRLENGQLAVEKQAYKATIKEMREELWVKDDSLRLLIGLYRNPDVVYRIKTITKFDTIRIAFDVPVEVDFERSFEKKTDHYLIAGLVNQDGLDFNTIEIPNTQRIVTGIKRGKFTTDITTTITNSNPFITTSDMQTQKQTIRNRRLGIGVFAGIDSRLDPTVGLGVNYNLIQF